ncbi:efflux transporter outer membrane subunit [Myxococcota bacterium]|nr:efflux transporter outer membrane subunit [Myxococcota bacterium]
MKKGCAITLGLVALLVSGCALTPDYERPELNLPAGWERTTAEQDAIANRPWWDIYGDEVLRALIDRALDQNRDLAIALARLQESRYLLNFTRADQFPFLDVFGSAGRGRDSKNINPLAGTENNFGIGADLSFEIDLWRRYSRATEAARAELLASEFGVRNVTISLIAEVASLYFRLQDVSARLEISRRTVEGRAERLGIIQARFDRGIEPEIDVNQAQVQLAVAEASVTRFQRLTAQTEHALRVVLGEFPGRVPVGPRIDFSGVPLSVPAGLPSELLKRRPDVQEAEQLLVAETAEIGVAQALRFPSLSLTSGISVVATDLTDLNSMDAGQWSLAAGIFQPIFNSGRLKAQKKAQVARAEQAEEVYILTLLEAFREVEDAIVATETFRNEFAARARQVKAAANALRLSQARYDAGVVDYLEVLDSERTFFDAELRHSQAHRSVLTSFVALYKALGGGWDERVLDDETE